MNTPYWTQNVPETLAGGAIRHPPSEATASARPRTSGHAPGASAFDTLKIDLLTVRDNEVQYLNRCLIDVVFELLGLAVENGEADQRGDRRDQPERGAVHGLGNTFCED